ncbi:HAD family hydrolase [Clostridioides sp. ZZV14-6105]|uniref:HAD family hydrolase n=1 Tax=Clostridioides sp. ZZV14-6105 TaxID=2811492 RepID=UPI001D12CF87|nr:HAD family phosphatase [Clostridioides sp. ZZV14-6105]WLD27603.1 5-amino-6-(5-phospho-D-ribitylamino)uracil phosphatase YcsE [Clostridioides difficile]
MIKHIFCDLDGTLYENGAITKEDIATIEEIEKSGVQFNVATGRVFKQARDIIEGSLDMNGYYICENGAFIHDKDYNVIFKQTIDDKLVKKVIDRFESTDAQLYFKYKGDVIVDSDTTAFRHYSSDFIVDPDFEKRDSFDNLIGNIGICSENLEELSRIELYLKREFREVLEIYFSSTYTLNIVPKSVSKRGSIEHVIKTLNVNPDEVATIGDSPNDICMLEGFKYSFVMSKAREEVKQSANYVVDSVKSAIDAIIKINN